MTLESQVTSLKLSQRLQKLGFPQESLSYWLKSEGEDWRCEPNLISNITHVSAYSVAELGEMLPAQIEFKYKGALRHAWLSCNKTHNPGKGDNLWECIYGDEGKIPVLAIGAATEAEARGLMLAYLKENNLI